MDHTVKTFLLTALFMFAWTVKASAPTSDPTELVPGGQVVQLSKREVKVKTPKGTIIEVDFLTNGNFEEASGDNVASGDVLVPGAGLLELKEIFQRVSKDGIKPVGEWSLENSLLHGWTYEFNGFENGRKMEYEIDAATGKILSSRIDD